MAETDKRCAYCNAIITIYEIREVDSKFAQLTTAENEDVCDSLGLTGPNEEARVLDNQVIYLHPKRNQGKIYNVCKACFKTAEAPIE